MHHEHVSTSTFKTVPPPIDASCCADTKLRSPNEDELVEELALRGAVPIEWGGVIRGTDPQYHHHFPNTHQTKNPPYNGLLSSSASIEGRHAVDPLPTGAYATRNIHDIRTHLIHQTTNHKWQQYLVRTNRMRTMTMITANQAIEAHVLRTVVERQYITTQYT
jgi:hypothetical protein